MIKQTKITAVSNELTSFDLLGGNVKYPFGVGSQHFATVSVMGLRKIEINYAVKDLLQVKFAFY